MQGKLVGAYPRFMPPFDSTYDAEVDAAYFLLTPRIDPGEATRQETVSLPNGDLILDFNSDGHLLGLEILGARSIVTPAALATLRRID